MIFGFFRLFFVRKKTLKMISLRCFVLFCFVGLQQLTWLKSEAASSSEGKDDGSNLGWSASQLGTTDLNDLNAAIAEFRPWRRELRMRDWRKSPVHRMFWRAWNSKLLRLLMKKRREESAWGIACERGDQIEPLCRVAFDWGSQGTGNKVVWWA